MTTAATAEDQRLAAVHRYEVLDTPPDGAFDRITSLAARMLDVPIAIVSIVDTDRIWFKSRYQLEVDEIGRDPGLCASAIMSSEPLVIPDALLDPIALANPLVAGDFGLRFYAASPLTTPDGHNLGTLCVIDREPRQITRDEVEILNDLAAIVVHELEVRLSARRAVASATAEKRLADELAATLQASLLPPHLPRIPGAEVAAHYRPADRSQVGGDFYDLFPLPAGAWGVVIGDVCGKGPAAAAVTAASRYALRAAAIEHESPAEVLRVVNETMLLDPNPECRFCTLIFARISPCGDGFDVVLASGGHPLPCLLRADGTVESVGTNGHLIGVVADVAFADRSATLSLGDTLVFSTDGLSEGPDGSATGRLGSEGVSRLVGSLAGQPVAAMVEQLAVAPEGSDRAPTDDLAIIALQITG